MFLGVVEAVLHKLIQSTLVGKYIQEGGGGGELSYSWSSFLYGCGWRLVSVGWLLMGVLDIVGCCWMLLSAVGCWMV